jgi:CRISPR-associated protein Cmr3
VTTNKVWVIEPRDPFIARDGKPFGVGVSAATLPFPYPSTTTGGIRTRAGLSSGGSFIDANGKPDQILISKVRSIETKGALLVELNGDNEIEDWLMPAPADALLLEHQSDHHKARVKRLVPLNIGDGITNLKQDPHGSDNLAPVGLSEFDPHKPFQKAPRFWRWCNYEKWLLEPDNLPLAVNPKYLGHDGAIVQIRTHVALNPETWTAQQGQLFQTRGLEFTWCGEPVLGNTSRLAMAVSVGNQPLAQSIDAGLAPLGGERRTVAWRASAKQLPSECLGEIATQVAKDRACRVVLLTPAYFTNGSRPTWLLSKQHNVKPELIGFANARAEVISGWDFEHYENTNGRVVRGQPKPTRRLMPGGSTFFLKLTANTDSEIRAWVEQMWMNCVSDDATNGSRDQYRHDGFALAAIGVWDGKLQDMKI